MPDTTKLNLTKAQLQTKPWWPYWSKNALGSCLFSIGIALGLGAHEATANPAPLASNLLVPADQTNPAIVHSERGFSLRPPPGYEVIQREGISLLLMSKKAADSQEFRSQIGVYFNAEDLKVDQFILDDYSKKIPTYRLNAFSAGTDYSIQTSSMISLHNQMPAALFYTVPFKQGELTLREMHILVGAASGHFLLTYTDLAEHFESTAESSPLSLAYQSMLSMTVREPVSGRFDHLVTVGVGFSILLVLIALWRVWEGRRHNRFEEDHAYVEALKSATATDMRPIKTQKASKSSKSPQKSAKSKTKRSKDLSWQPPLSEDGDSSLITTYSGSDAIPMTGYEEADDGDDDDDVDVKTIV